jgi:hypothetical protein
VTRRRPIPWAIWGVGWLALIVLAGGLATVAARRSPRPVETVVTDVHVLPPGQTKVTGTFRSLQLTDAVGPPLRLPVRAATGTVTIDHAEVDGQRASIVWQGGRPFVLGGDGGIDLGPTTVTIDGRGATWPIDGRHPLRPGHYRVDAPVAVGTGGIATSRDAVDFVADSQTTIDVGDRITVTTSTAQLRLEGPGQVVGDGRFRLVTGDGSDPQTAVHLQFGPGPFVVDVDRDAIAATLQGPVRPS